MQPHGFFFQGKKLDDLDNAGGYIDENRGKKNRQNGDEKCKLTVAAAKWE